MLGPLTSLNSQVANPNALAPKNEQSVLGRDQNKPQTERLKETKPQGTESAQSQDSETRNPYSPFQTAYYADASPAPVLGTSSRGSNIDIVI